MTEEAKEPGFAASLLWGTAFVLAADAGIVGVNAAMMPYRSGGTIFLGWLLVVIVVVVSSAIAARRLYGEPALFFIPVILFAVFGVVYGLEGGRLPRMFSLRETPEIPVAQADQRPHCDADVFRFSDGGVRLSLQNSLTRRIRTGRIVYYVAPVVAEGWKETDPITLWVAAEGPRESLQTHWRKDLRGGYRAAADTVFDELIQEQVARRHLVSRVNAPVIVWSENPRRELESKIRFELWSLMALDLLSLASIVFAPLARALRKPARK